ncbi:MAG: toxin-antitoxin system YwqK family antitoxin [Saprospiraceae bacterium]|nr:toxin-antitoxin system YwqK family antitoxin [Saprospiraceae bacterium]
MKLVPQILAILLLTWMGCFNKMETVELRNEAGQLEERYEIDKATGQKEGSYMRYRDGILIETALYTRDTLEGIRILYFDNGNKEIQETYVMGTYHGPYQSFYDSGQLKLEGQYQKGTMEGPWTKYYESGQIMEVVEMHKNQENGPFVEYYESGNLKAEGTYLEGDNEDGELRLFNEQGILEKKMQCDAGICHTTWMKED